MNIKDMAVEAKHASIKLAVATSELKNKALNEIIKGLEKNKDEIIKANKEDLDRSEKENLAMPLLKRLKFDEEKIDDVIQGIKSLIALDDPVNITQGTMGK